MPYAWDELKRDCDPGFNRHEIRHLCLASQRGARGNHQAGEAIFESNACAGGEPENVQGLGQIFCSTSHSINVQKIFKIVLAKAFDLKVSGHPDRCL